MWKKTPQSFQKIPAIFYVSFYMALKYKVFLLVIINLSQMSRHGICFAIACLNTLKVIYIVEGEIRITFLSGNI